MTDLQLAVLLSIVAAVAAVLVAGLLFRLLVQSSLDRSPSEPRPWWGNPLIWLGASGVLILLGIFVAPQFLPGVVIFVPFLWIGGSRRWTYPRNNGHG